MLDTLRQAEQPMGLRVGAVSAAHLPELKAEFEALHEAGDMGETSYRITKGLTEINEAAGARTILIAAAPSPIRKLIFHHGGKPHTALLPPTYTDYVRKPPEIEKAFSAALMGTGCSVKYFDKLPEKLLAVRSGLGQYGRNNITYVDGMGSFHYLSTYITDASCEDGWRESHRMTLCDGCTLCRDHCPTGAILPDRRVIDVDRCLTWHNERNSSTPFPEWLDSRAHNSLVGCIRCQSVCPANKEHMRRFDAPVGFDEEETALLLEGRPFESLPQELKAKLEKTCVNEFYDVVARNLKALIEQ